MSDQMPMATRVKLSAMMFLQFMMFAVFWGALATYVTNNKWDAMKPWILSTMPLGALASPVPAVSGVVEAALSSDAPASASACLKLVKIYEGN